MTQTPLPTADEFWHWSVDFYGRAGVSTALLTLQDHDGADVNILLMLFCLSGYGYGVPEPAMPALDAAIAPWRHEIVEPLRTIRRRLKPMGEDAVRKAVATAEIEAERVGQRHLLAALPHLTPVAGEPAGILAAHSLRAYAAYLGRPLDTASREVLLTALD